MEAGTLSHLHAMSNAVAWDQVSRIEHIALVRSPLWEVLGEQSPRTGFGSCGGDEAPPTRTQTLCSLGSR
jgi:hypothetical protein